MKDGSVLDNDGYGKKSDDNLKLEQNRFAGGFYWVWEKE